MNTANHEKFTRSMFSGLGIPWNKQSELMMKKVNHDIDNSSPFLNAFNKMQNQKYKNDYMTYGKKNPYDFMGLTGGGGHRTYNHDLLTGSLIAAMNARAMGMPFKDGMMMAYSHFAADNMANHLVKQMGVDGKNVFESLFAWNTRKRRY